MTILEASVSAGSVVGGIASAYVLRAVGMTYLLLIGATLNALAYAFTNICLKESLTECARVSNKTIFILSIKYLILVLEYKNTK